eukprot:gene10616-2738_t
MESDWDYAGIILPCMILTGVLTLFELYFIGVGGSLRQKYNAVVVRLLYVAYFILFGFLVSWTQQRFSTLGDATISFNYHPLLMSIAWVFCSTEAALSFRSPGNAKRQKRKLYHATMNFISFGFSISGIVIVFLNHQQKKSNHLSTQHSWIGLATAVCMTVQFLLGYFAFYVSNHQQWKLYVLEFHKFVGAMTYISALFTISLGLFNNYGIKSDSNTYSMDRCVNKTATVILWSIGIRVLAGFFPSEVRVRGISSETSGLLSQ